jgi:hypothetical protein
MGEGFAEVSGGLLQRRRESLGAGDVVAIRGILALAMWLGRLAAAQRSGLQGFDDERAAAHRAGPGGAQVVPVVGVVGLNQPRHFDLLPRGEHLRSGDRAEAASGERLCPGVTYVRRGVLRMKHQFAQRDGIALHVFRHRAPLVEETVRREDE